MLFLEVSGSSIATFAFALHPFECVSARPSHDYYRVEDAVLVLDSLYMPLRCLYRSVVVQSLPFVWLCTHLRGVRLNNGIAHCGCC